MCLIYGTAMPIMWPIAVAGFAVLYINERLLVAYYYNSPPAYDTEITQMAFSVVRSFPLLSLPFVFWQVGNR